MSLIRRHGRLQQKLKPLLLLALVVFVFTASNESAKIAPASESKPAKLRERTSQYTRRQLLYTEVPPYIDIISSNFSFDTLPVIDTISMGHKQSEAGRLTLQAQRESWVTAMPGSRFFFAATEDVCFPECLSQNVTSEERDQICNTDTPAPGSDRPTFWSHRMLHSFGKESSGWWCAQKRVAWALRDMLNLYRSPEMDYSFPDWMLIVDDDTWFNPYLLPKTLSHMSHMKVNMPIAIAPNIIVSDNLDEPSLHYGGVGLAVNRYLLKAMNRPIYCNIPNPNVHCRRLKKAGLLSQFQDGMFLIDFMVELLSRRVSCLHSDWWQGILIWLAGSRTEITQCEECVDVTGRWGKFDLHMKGSCGPKMLSCHRMTHLRMPDMTEMALNCSRNNFVPFVPCQQIMSFGEKKDQIEK